MESIERNGFSVSVRSPYASRIYKNGYNYIALKHNTEYSLELQNNTNNRCDAVVTIDGRSVGKFRINSYSGIVVERPVTKHQKFVFLRESSGDAYRAGITEGKYANGSVSITFYPEMHKFHSRIDYDRARGFPYTNSSSETHCTKSYSMSSDIGSFNYMDVGTMSAGATALGDRSHQLFKHASELDSIDHNNITTIKFRLVVDDDLYQQPIKIRDEEWPTIMNPYHLFHPIIQDRHDFPEPLEHQCHCYRSRTPPRWYESHYF